MRWTTARFDIDLDTPRVMGIVNVTPDSFSDGGRHAGHQAALAHCEQLNRAGIEKYVLGHSALNNALVRALSRDMGSQAVVACVDVAGQGATARCVTLSGRQQTGHAPLALCRQLQDEGVGEIILQSIEFDGKRTGFDLDLIRQVAPHLSIPVIALGGAGEAAHLAQALQAGASAAASGSAFVFIGRLRAVLVSYPSMSQMDALVAAYA